MLGNKESRDSLMMPARMVTTNLPSTLLPNELSVDVSVHNLRTHVPYWMPIANYKQFNLKQYSYFLSIIDLASELCLGRNGNSVEHL